MPRRSATPQPDPFPDRLSPQLATLVSGMPSGPGWAYEIKFDGYRILVRIVDGAMRLFTRNGNDWKSKMASLATEAPDTPMSPTMEPTPLVDSKAERWSNSS